MATLFLLLIFFGFIVPFGLTVLSSKPQNKVPSPMHLDWEDD